MQHCLKYQLNLANLNIICYQQYIQQEQMASMIKIQPYYSRSPSTADPKMSSLSLSKQIKQLKQKITQLFPKTPQPHCQQCKNISKNIQKDNKDKCRYGCSQSKYNQNIKVSNCQNHNKKNADKHHSLVNIQTPKIKTQKNLYYSKYANKGTKLPKITPKNSNCSLKSNSDIKLNPAYKQLKKQMCPTCSIGLDKNNAIQCQNRQEQHRSLDSKLQKYKKQAICTQIDNSNNCNQSSALKNCKELRKKHCTCIQTKNLTKIENHSNRMLSIQQLFNELGFQSEFMKMNKLHSQAKQNKNQIVSVKPIKFSEKVTPRKIDFGDMAKKQMVKIRRKKTNRSHLLQIHTPFVHNSSRSGKHRDIVRVITERQAGFKQSQCGVRRSTVQIRGWTLSNREKQAREREEDDALMNSEECRMQATNRSQQEQQEQEEQEIAVVSKSIVNLVNNKKVGQFQQTSTNNAIKQQTINRLYNKQLEHQYSDDDYEGLCDKSTIITNTHILFLQKSILS